MAQVVKYLPSKCEALSSKLSTEKKKKDSLDMKIALQVSCSLWQIIFKAVFEQF
jgi:hypothetical protein